MNKKILVFGFVLMLVFLSMFVSADDGKQFVGKWGYIGEGACDDWDGVVYIDDFFINMTYLDGYAVVDPVNFDPLGNNKSICGYFYYDGLCGSFYGFAFIYNQHFYCFIYVDWFGENIDMWFNGSRI